MPLLIDGLLVADHNAHRTGGTGNHAHSGLQAAGVQVAHLHLSDLLNGSLGNGGDLVLIGDAGTRLDVALLLDQNGQRTR